MLKQFLKWVINLLRSKPQQLHKSYTNVEKQPQPRVEPKIKIHTLAFRKQQLVNKAFVTRTHMIHITKFLGISDNKFKYQVTYKKLI